MNISKYMNKYVNINMSMSRDKNKNLNKNKNEKEDSLRSSATMKAPFY